MRHFFENMHDWFRFIKPAKSTASARVVRGKPKAVKRALKRTPKCGEPTAAGTCARPVPCFWHPQQDKR